MAARTLYLIRHAQYRSSDAGTEVLTVLGRRQAVRLGMRLRAVQFATLFHSDAPRAVQTAEILAGLLPALPRIGSRLLREGIPSIPAHLAGQLRLSRADAARTRERMDRAFARFVRSSRSDRNELIVAHGNIIRYLIRRSLGDSPRSWWRLDIQQCSLTIVRVSRERCTLLGFNDVGHLSPALQTYR